MATLIKWQEAIFQDGLNKVIILMKQAIYRKINWLKKTVIWLLLFILLFHASLSLILSQLNYFRTEIENIVSQFLHAPVRIDHLHGSLVFLNPQIKASNITIQKIPNHEDQSIQSMGFTVNFLETIQARKLVLSKLMVSKATFNVIKNDRQWYLAALEELHFNQKGSHIQSGDKAVFSLPVLVDHIRIKKSKLRITDKNSGIINTLVVSNLYLQHQDENTVINGQLSVNESPVVLKGSFCGNIARPDTVSSKVYLDAKELDAAPWINLFVPEKSVQISPQLPVTAQSWFNWSASEWEVTGKFNMAGTDILINNKKIPSLNKFNGTVQVNGSSVKKWSAQLTIHDLITGNVRQEISRLSLRPGSTPEPSVQMEISGLDLDTLKKPVLESDLLSARYKKVMESLNPSGRLSEINFLLYLNQSAEPLKFEARGHMDNMSINAWQGVPSVKNISGDIVMNTTHGFIDIDSTNATIGLPQVFKRDWQYETLAGKFYWHIFPDNYVLHTPDTVAASGKNTRRVSLKLTVPRFSKKPVEMSLKVMSDNLDASAAREYLPLKVLPVQLGSWLESSIDEGMVKNAVFSWEGPLKKQTQHPFNWNLDLNLVDVNFHYDSEWPDITHMDAVLKLNQDGLTVTNASGSIYGSHVSDIEATMEDFADSVLNISAYGRLSGRDAQKILAGTPINRQLNSAPKDWKIDGDYDTELKLRLPLASGSNKEKEHFEVTAETRNGQFIPEEKFNFEHIQGTMRFASDTGLQAQSVHADFLGNPATIDISNEPLGETKHITYLTLNSHATPADIQHLLPVNITELAKGQFNYHAQVGIPSEGGLFIQVESDLAGLSVDLPPPFNKPAEGQNTTSLLLTPQGNNLTLSARYGSLLGAKIRLENNRPVAGRININPVNTYFAELPENAITVTGSLGALDLDAWSQWYLGHSFLLPEKTVVSDNKNFQLPLISLNAFKINSVFYKKHHFGETALTARLEKGKFQARVKSDILTGTVTRDTGKIVDIELSTLKLSDGIKQVISDNHHTEPVNFLHGLNLSQFPAVNFTTKNIQVNNTPYGTAKFKLVSTEDSLKFNQIDVILGGLKIQGELIWSAHQQEKSAFHGSFSTHDLNQVFKNWNYKTRSFSAREANVCIDGTWPGSPVDFNFSKASGESMVSLHKGQIQGAAEVTDPLHFLGILNIEAISRRLRLDFSDLLTSGIAFDDIKGHFAFDKGVIKLDKPLVIKGPSSDFTLDGVINFPEKMINAGLIVTLPVTQNLPIIGLLIGQPAIAGAIYLFDKLVGKKLTRFTSVRYEIKGPIANPEVKLDKLFSDKLKKSNDTNSSF